MWDAGVAASAPNRMLWHRWLSSTSVLRAAVRGRWLDDRRAALALTDLVDLPLERAPHTPLLVPIWQLAANVTPYDAAYVALAEALDVGLLTADRRLARARGPTCEIEVVA